MMSETNEPKYSDYTGHTTGVSIYPHAAGYAQNANGFVVGDFSEGETTVNDYRQANANAALFVAAADPLTGYVATLAKLAAMERERDDWERRAFAAGAERDHWRANHASVVDRRERRTIAIQEGRA